MSCETCPLLCDLRETSQELREWSMAESSVVAEQEVSAEVAMIELASIRDQSAFERTQLASARMFEEITGIPQPIPEVDEGRGERLKSIQDTLKVMTSGLLSGPLLSRAPSEAERLSNSADFTEKHCAGEDTRSAAQKARDFIFRRTVECHSPGAYMARDELQEIKSHYPEINPL